MGRTFRRFTIALVCAITFAGILGGASSQAVAKEVGTNFKYEGEIGVGNAYLPTLATVFARVDAAISAVKASIANVVTMTSAAAGSGNVLTSGGANRTAVASSTALSNVALYTTLISTANGFGASRVGIEDVGTYYTATTVEGALAELGAAVARTKLAVTATDDTAACNATDCLITTKSLTTAAGTSYTITITNPKIVAGSVVHVSAEKGTNTVVKAMGIPYTVDRAAHTVAASIVNTDDAAPFDGTMVLNLSVF